MGITGKQVQDDSLTGADIDESTLEIEFPSFLVFGQEQGLTSQTSVFEARTTNGTQNGEGWRMPVSGKVTHISAQFNCSANDGTVEFRAELYKNGSAVSGAKLTMSISATGSYGAVASFESNPYSFAAGDRLTLFLSHDRSGTTTEQHAFMVRVLS